MFRPAFSAEYVPYDGGRQLAGTLEGLTAAAAGVSGEPIQVDAVSGTYSDENAGRNKDGSLTLDLSGAEAVSYTHLDVYKRQDSGRELTREEYERLITAAELSLIHI